MVDRGRIERPTGLCKSPIFPIKLTAHVMCISIYVRRHIVKIMASFLPSFGPAA
jgi:hypothetical protein